MEFLLLLVLLVPFLFILVAPYALYFDSQKLDKPIVVFQIRFWRNALPLLMTGALFGIAIMIASTLFKVNELLMVVICLPLAVLTLRWGFIGLWLHLTYWRHDRRATLKVCRLEQTATYTDAGSIIRFALADVVSVTTYDSYRPSKRRAMWQEYSYQLWQLQDGTWFVLTCLLYSFSGPDDLLPAALRRTIRPRICWLPGDPLMNLSFFN